MKFPAPNFRLEVLAVCGSTSELLLGRRDSPDFSGSALMALRQTAGFGRRGREWWSGEGNLALSLALRIPTEGAQVALLPFLAGLAMMDLLRHALSPSLQLKWPNDIYLRGKKLAGLLTQARQSEDSLDVVLGIGLNLSAAPPGEDAIAMAEVAEPFEPEVLAKLFLANFTQRLASFENFEPLRLEWEAAARLVDCPLTILGEPGDYWGSRLLPTGELEVRDSAGGLRALASETVSLRFRATHPSL